MKKFIILQLSIILTGAVILTILKSRINDIGVLTAFAAREQYDTSNAYLSSILTEEDIPDNFEDYYERVKLSNELYDLETAVIMCTPKGAYKSYNYMCIQDVHVDEVIVGDQDIKGNNITLYDYDRSFVFEEEDMYQRRLQHLPELGYSKEEFPEYYKRSMFYYACFNVMKTDHQYILFAGYKESMNKKFFKLAGAAIPYFDTKEIDNKPIENNETLPLFSDYINNEFYVDSNMTDEKIANLKSDIMKEYEIAY